MKKRTLILIVFLSTFMFGYSQTEQGALFLGTTTNISGTLSEIIRAPNNSIGIGKTTMKYKDENGDVQSENEITSFNFAPQIGYFLSNGFVCGLGVDYFSLKSVDTDDNDESTFSLFMAGPFVRYYIPVESGKVMPYAHAGLSFGKTKDKYESSSFNSSHESNLKSYNGSLGLAVFLNESISIDIQGNYSFFSEKDEEDDDETTESNLGLKVGVGIFLSRK